MPKKPKKEEATIQICYSQETIVACCPVCRGNGLVPNGFYNKVGACWTTGSIAFEKCKSCEGEGYVVVKENVINTMEGGKNEQN